MRFVVRIDRPDPPQGVIEPEPADPEATPRLLPFAGWLALLGRFQELVAAAPPLGEDGGDGPAGTADRARRG